jgi:phage terminase Nu1 subunit (DNA packaging protein)
MKRKEFAEFISVSESTVRRLIKKGLPVVGVVGHGRIDPVDALKWMKEQTEEPKNER